MSHPSQETKNNKFGIIQMVESYNLIGRAIINKANNIFENCRGKMI